MINFKNRYAVHTLRTLFGLFMIFSGVSGFLVGMEGIPEPMRVMTQALWDAGIFQMIKVTEIVSGLMLVLNFVPALAMLFIAPIAVGVIVFNANVSPAYLPMGIVLAIFTAYFGFVYWDKYKAIFKK